MNKEYAFLIDAIRDERYGIVIKSTDGFEFHGFNDNSEEWSNWANKSQIGLSELPSGVGVGEFKPLTKSVEELIKSNNQWSFVQPESSKDKHKFVSERQRFDSSSILPSVYDGPISRRNRNTSITFKAAALRNEIAMSELAFAHRLGRIAFDASASQFSFRPSIAQREISRGYIRDKISSITERRFGKQLIEQLNSSSIPANIGEERFDDFIPGVSGLAWLRARSHRGSDFVSKFKQFEPGSDSQKWIFDVATAFIRRGLTNRKRRKKKRFKSVDVFDINEKAIGRRIGYGAANAARGLRGNRRNAARTMARIEGVLDPRMRRDVDGDGMIFDGTWREMPDPTRVLEKPETSVRATSGNPNILRIRSRGITNQRAADFAETINLPSRTSGERTPGMMRRISLGAGPNNAGDTADVAIGAQAGEGEYLEQLMQVTQTNTADDLFAYLRAAKIKRDRWKSTDPKKWNDEDIYNARSMGGLSLQQVAEKMGIDRTEVRAREQRHMRSLRSLEKQKIINSAIDSELFDSDPESGPVAINRFPRRVDGRRRPQKVRKRIAGREERSNSVRENADKIYESFTNGATVSELAEQYGTVPSRIRRAIAAHQQSLREGRELSPPVPGTGRQSILGTARLTDVTTGSPSFRSQSRQSRAMAVPMSSRRSTAVTQRAANIPGLRIGKRNARPGRDKVADSDGKMWSSLSDDEKTKATDAAKKLREAIELGLKEGAFRSWWENQAAGPEVEGIVRTRKGNARAYTDRLGSGDLVEMRRILDQALKAGRVQQYETDENGNIVKNADGTPKEAKSSKSYFQIERLLDDLTTLAEMEESGNWNLLEHLHPAAREHILANAIGEIKAPALPKDSNTPKRPKKTRAGSIQFDKLSSGKARERDFDVRSVSSIYKKGGGISAERLSDDELRSADERIRNRRIRLLRMSEARRRRREIRRQRAGRGFRKATGITYDPKQEMKKRAIRRKQAVRKIKALFRTTRNPDDAVRMIEKQRMRLHPVIFNDDGSVTIDSVMPRLVGTLHQMKQGEKAPSQKTYDDILATTWESTGFSQEPILLREDEIKLLVEAGWQPIIRGVGGVDDVEAEGYVEQFLTNPQRFTPGQAGRAYGLGEYFSVPGSTRWDSYGGGGTKRTTIVALLPPTAKVIGERELKQMQRDLAQGIKPIMDEIKSRGGRDAVKALSGEEIVDFIEKAAPELSERTDIGSQIVSAMVKELARRIAAGNDDQEFRENIVDSLLYFEALSTSSNRDALGYLAPLLGIDAHVPNDADDVILLHNRGAIVANIEPVSRQQGREITGPIGMVWQKFKDYKKPSDVRSSRRPKGKRARERERQLASDSTVDSGTKAALVGAVDVTGWRRIPGTSAGSNMGQQFEDAKGVRYFVKPQRSDNDGTALERAQNEVVASKLYQLFGVDTLDLQLGSENGEPRVVSQYRNDLSNIRSGADVKKTADDFIVDALLGNWDAVENDNTRVSSAGKAVRTDVGGAMQFRARGASKGTDWNEAGEEIESMRGIGRYGSRAGSGARRYYGSITPEDIRKQIQKIMQVSEQDIRDTIASVIKDPARAKEMADMIIKRRQNIATLAQTLKG